MPGPDTLVEEAPVGLTFSLTLAAALYWIVAWGILLLWAITFGPILEGIANAVKIDVLTVHLDPAGALRTIDHWVRKQLQNQIAAGDTAIGYWWHQTARLQGWIVDETWKIARDTFHFGEWMVHVYVPAYVHGLTDVLHGVAGTVTKVIHLTETKIVHLTKIVYVTAKNAAAITVPNVAIPHVAEWQWIHRHWKALTAAVAAAGAIAVWPPLAIPRLWRGIDEAESEIRKLMKRVTRVEALFGATALAIAMANVLGLKSWRCLRGGPISKVSRALCGLSSRALEDLLGLLVDVVLIANVCEVTNLLNQAVSLVQGPITDFVSVAEGALCNGDFGAPPALSVAALSLPPVTGVTLSLA